MANKRDRTKAAIVKRLSEVRIVEIACKSVGVSRATHYRWLKDDPQFERDCEEAIRQGTAVICDLAESQIVAKIRSGDFRASTYFLEKHHDDYKPKPRTLTDSSGKNPPFVLSERAVEHLAAISAELELENDDSENKTGQHS